MPLQQSEITLNWAINSRFWIRTKNQEQADYCATLLFRVVTQIFEKVGTMKRKLRNNGLSIVMFLLFGVTLLGQIVTGHRVYNEDQKSRQQQEVGIGTYLTSGHFIEALFENWESEFLQMGFYVVLTVFLFQKGSAESNDPDASEREAEAKIEDKSKLPAPIRKGGWVLKLYENSLGLSLLALFVVAFLLHASGGAREYSVEQQAHGEPGIGLLAYMGTAQFWFESFQNWQSEFFSIGILVVFSIYLRQKGSPESKPMAATHDDTGTG